jgi:hypothetical protein
MSTLGLCGLATALSLGVSTAAGTALDAKIERRMAKVRAGLDHTFIVEREGIYVVASNLPMGYLERIRRGTIRRCSEAMWEAYFRKKPDYPIAVYLFRDDQSYRAWAKRLFGDDRVSHFGYYRPWDHTMVMNTKGGRDTGTLVHEMTHALMKPDFPDVPTWFDEGLASLHEQCQVGRDTIRGLENWRLPSLQKAIRAGRLVPLTELVATTAGEFRGPKQGLHYAEARYLVMYLQHLGLLRRFYREFRQSVHKDPTGATTLAAVVGKPIAELEKEWVPWVLKLRFPPER